MSLGPSMSPMPRTRPTVRDARAAFDVQAGRRLAALRSAAGISQAELGARIGVPQSVIGKVEGGTRRLSLQDALALARALDVDVTVLDPTRTLDPSEVDTDEALRS